MKTTLLFFATVMCLSAHAQTDETDSLRTQQIEEIVVRGETPQIRGQGGMTIVDLPSIVKDKPVTNILEALGYLPGVTNNGGKVGLTGASSVSIILNGEPTNMPVENLYQLLYSTPVDRLKNVEIMYSAPAKYHVDGAVINIVLKTPTPLDGLQGQVRAGYNQGHYASYGTGLAATYAVGKWMFDLAHNLSRSKSWNSEQNSSNHLVDGTRILIDEDSRWRGSNLANIVYASAAYKFSERSRISITYNGQIISSVKQRSHTFGTLGEFSNRVHYNAPITFHNIAVRYASPFGLTVGGDYTAYREDRTQNMFSLPEGADLVKASNMQHIDKYHAYIDQVHDISGWQISYGAEYQQSNDRSRQTFELPAEAGFDGTLKETVANAYIGLQHSFAWGLSFNLSAKGEYYHNDDRDNWNFIPQFGATFSKNPKSIFQLDFTAQRVYPAYWELHSGTAYFNDYSMVVGNPALQPYIDYSGQLSYIFRQKYVATLYVQYGDKATVQLPYQSPDELKLIYQTVNMNFKRVAGLNLHIPFSIKHILDSSVTLNLFNQREKADRFHDIGFDNRKWIFYGSLNNSIKFTKNSPVSLSIDFAYISPSLQGIADLSQIWRIDAGVKWQFGKKRCCELDLKFDDVFNTWSPVLTIDHAGQEYRKSVYDMTRNLKLTFIWRFNGFKPKDTAIDTSRFGTGK